MIDLINESWKCYVDTKEEFENAKNFLEKMGFDFLPDAEILEDRNGEKNKVYLTNSLYFADKKVYWGREDGAYTRPYPDATKQILGEENVFNMKAFNMKTQPWFIRINSQEEFDVVDKWLLDNHGVSLDCRWNGGHMVGLTNTTDSGHAYEDHIMWYGSDDIGNIREEIKFSFKTVIDSVEFPEVVSEEQKEIERLTKIIEEAQQSLNKLKGE